MAKKKILIAEDDEDILDSVTQLLENAGYKVEGVVHGQKIISRMEKILPDLLLLDISMPGTDGRDICIVVKKNKLIKNTPIILMTANNDIKKIAEKAGAEDFIAKPFSIDNLLEKIQKHIT